ISPSATTSNSERTALITASVMLRAVSVSNQGTPTQTTPTFPICIPSVPRPFRHARSVILPDSRCHVLSHFLPSASHTASPAHYGQRYSLDTRSNPTPGHSTSSMVPALQEEHDLLPDK